MYTHEQPKGTRLHDAYNFIDSIFGPGITPFPAVQAMQDKNSNFIHAIFNQQSGAVEGYFSLIPLNKEASNLVSQNILHGADIGPEHIVDEQTQPSGYYLGAVAALNNRKTRMVTMRFMLRYLDTYIDKTKPFFTRPITKDGHRLCIKKGFTPVVERPDEHDRLIFKLPTL